MASNLTEDKGWNEGWDGGSTRDLGSERIFPTLECLDGLTDGQIEGGGSSGAV